MNYNEFLRDNIIPQVRENKLCINEKVNEVVCIFSLYGSEARIKSDILSQI